VTRLVATLVAGGLLERSRPAGAEAYTVPRGAGLHVQAFQESTSTTYPAELLERAVRMVGEIRADHKSDLAAMTKGAELLGIGTPETVRKWSRRAEVDAG
jgi:hypothetical protein